MLEKEGRNLSPANEIRGFPTLLDQTNNYDVIHYLLSPLNPLADLYILDSLNIRDFLSCYYYYIRYFTMRFDFLITAVCVFTKMKRYAVESHEVLTMEITMYRILLQ